MSRCSWHSQGRNACVLILFIWYTSHTHSIASYLLDETMENATMVRVIRVVGECRIVPSVDQWSHSSFPQNSLGSSRINSNDSLSSSTLTRRIVPFRVLKNNWTTIIRIKQQLKLTQGLFFDLMQSCIVTWCRIFREGSNLNIEIHKHFKRPKFLKSKCASQDDLL